MCRLSRLFSKVTGVGVVIGLAIALAGCDGSSDEVTLLGENAAVGGTTITSSALLKDSVVRSVSLEVPYSLIQTMPAAGTGPLGAFATINFPTEVQNQTVLNHFEMHANPQGHEPVPVYGAAHYDLHFYGIPVATVRTIPGGPVDVAQTPAANRIPQGYALPNPLASVPEMGIHASPVTDFAQGAVFTRSLILGYHQGSMIFVEPMITQAFLQQKQNFTLDIPTPQTLGRTTPILYPTRFVGTYNAASNSYTFTLQDFVSLQ